MASRVIGALVRACLMVMMIITPSSMLSGISPDAVPIVALAALFAFALTLFEYASTYPGLVEFREAPPFNRIRFGALYATVLLLTLVIKGIDEPTVLTAFVTAVGSLVGQAIDFPYSPVRLVVLMLPQGATLEQIELIRTTAGMSYLISLLSLAAFVIHMRITGWPRRKGGFNVWVNLPMFDPTVGDDVVARLERDARFNVAFGFVLPFLTPVMVKTATDVFGQVSLAGDQALVWLLTAWAFLPASLFMRGIAMRKVATLISAQRARNSERAAQAGLQPA